MRYVSPVTTDGEYLRALGQATYSYCYMEWAAIYLIQKVDPEFAIYTTHTMSGGQIGASLKTAIKAAELTPDARSRLREAYAKFFELVELRSDILHAHPFTAAGGAQRLGRYKNGTNYEWGLLDLDRACKAFDDLSAELSDLFHNGFA